MVNINALFSEIVDSDERILWASNPPFWSFIFRGFPFLGLCLLWDWVDYEFFIHRGNAGEEPLSNISLPFLLLLLTPLWLAIADFIRLLFVYPNTYYALLNKRALLGTGFFGLDYNTIDYDRISDMRVSDNPLEKIFCSGTISLYTGHVGEGSELMRKMIALDKPYDSFRQLKQTAMEQKEIHITRTAKGE